MDAGATAPSTCSVFCLNRTSMLQDGVTTVRGAGALLDALLDGIYPDGQAPAAAPQRDGIMHLHTSLHSNQPALTDGHLQDLQPRGASAHVHLAGGSLAMPHLQDLQTRGAVTSVHLTGLGGSAGGAQGLTMPAWTPTLAPMQGAGPAVRPSAGTSQVDGFQGSFGGDEDEHSQRGSGGDNADPAQAEEDESERQNKRKYAPFAAPVTLRTLLAFSLCAHCSLITRAVFCFIPAMSSRRLACQCACTITVSGVSVRTSQQWPHTPLTHNTGPCVCASGWYLH